MNPQALEERVELLLFADVVVVLEHAQQGGLAEAARAEKDQVKVAGLGALEHREKRRFVGIKEAFRPNLSEIGDAVRNPHVPNPRTSFSIRRSSASLSSPTATTLSRSGRNTIS